MKLTKDELYEVQDWYCMLSFTAKYLGVVQDGQRLGSELHLVEHSSWQPPDPEAVTCSGVYRYAACELKAWADTEGNVRTWLYTTHYGNTIEGLMPAAGKVEPPQWRLVS